MASSSHTRYRQICSLVLAGLAMVLLPACNGGSSSSNATPPGGGKRVPGDVDPDDPGVAPQGYNLRFRNQPDNGIAGLPFGQTIVVEVVDKKAAIVDVHVHIEIQVKDPDGRARLGGSWAVWSKAGVATFTDLLVSFAGRDLTLLARSDAANPVVSEEFTRDVSPGKRHVILLVADGWGYKQVEATRTFTGKSANYEGFKNFPMTTWDTNVQLANGPMPYDPVKAWTSIRYLAGAVTDSASAATALYTGFKTNSGRVGVGPGVGGKRLVCIGELALRNGLGSGAVSSVPISHATPAAWAAHNDSRGYYRSITDEMLFGDPASTGTGYGGHGKIDVLPHVLIGGGHPSFTGGFYVTASQLEKAKKESSNPGGWQVAEKISGESGGANLLKLCAEPATKRLLGLYGGGGGNIAYRLHDGKGADPEDATLAEMARGALQVLGRQPKGFCLMIEGGAIDWAGHTNNMSQNIGEMIGFGEMVDEVIKWIEDPTNDSNWGNTLLVVTGDHETGLLTAGPGVLPDQPLGTVTAARIQDEMWDLSTGIVASWDDKNGDQMINSNETVYWAWNTGGHSNTLIPCYFKGIESDRFAKRIVGVDPVRGEYIDNTQVFRVMLRVLERE